MTPQQRYRLNHPERAARDLEKLRSYPRRTKQVRTRPPEPPQRRIRRVYGISETEYEAMKTAQNYRCAICNEIKELVLDYDHTIGRNRGMLCRGCNAFGLKNHTLTTYRAHSQAVIAYLKRYEVSGSDNPDSMAEGAA
jgi:hypothetical protein